MQPNKQKHVLYVVLLVLLSIICTSAVANNSLREVFTNIVALSDEAFLELTTPVDKSDKIVPPKTTTSKVATVVTTSTASPVAFATILAGADEEVTCSIDGSTLAKYFLCGTGDDRTLTLSQAGGGYTWQKLGAGCTFVGTDSCPVFNSACNSDWATVGTDPSFLLDASDVNVAGEYRVRVDSGAFYYFRVTSNPLDPQLAVEDIICGNPGTVEVTNVPSGYEYSLNSAAGPYQDNPSFVVIAPGNYQVYTRLKDASASACVFPSEVVTVSELDMTVDVSMTDITCSGDLGDVSVTVNNVPGFYSYRLLRNGVVIDTFGPNASNTYTFNNLGPGTYSVLVETNDCSVTVSDIAGDPIIIGDGLVPIDATAFATDSFGCGATSVDVTLDVSGGTAPYRYSLDAGATYSANFGGSIVFAVNSAGTYNILVEDANGCTKTAAVDVENIPPPVYNLQTVDANCGGANNGSLTVDVTNSNGYNIEYSIDNGVTYQSSNVFSNLAPGSYNVILRYQQDTFVCTTNPVSGTIGTPSTITASASATQTPTCLDENGGEITFGAVSGGVGPYEYSIGSGFSVGTTVFSGLSAGTYTPQVRDANGCVETLPVIVFNVLDKPTDINFTVSSIDCATGTASVSLAVVGGSAISTYEIVAPITVNNGGSNTFTGLGLGSYTFMVTDANGCTYSESFSITDISSIGALAQLVNNVTCVGDTDGEGRFIIDGFENSYSYQIDANPVVTNQTSNTIDVNGLAAGSYVISVTDEDTNCTETATLTIDAPAAPLAIAPIVTDMSCQNNNRGAVNANASGGWGSYRYTLTRPNSSTVGPRNNPNFTGLTDSGNYTITVVDSEGCSISSNFTLAPISSPSLVVDPVSDFCFDNTDAASLSVLASGGDGSYEYRINGGPWVASPTFSNLNPGNYTIQVRDGNNCRDSVTRTIRPQTTSTVTIQRELTCSLSGTNDAEILVNIANGNTPYQTYEVSFNSGAYGVPVGIVGSSFVYTTGVDGTYQFRITDNQGCVTETNVVTINPTEVIVATANVTDPRCGDPNTGIVELVPDTSVGIPPYEFSTDNVSYGTQAVFGNLAPGNYTYYVRDSRGCNVPVNFTVGPAAPGVDATVAATPAVCSAGVVEGNIDVTGVSNGIAPFVYTLVDVNGNTVQTIPATPSTTANFTNVVPGSYTVITTDAAGCEDRDDVILDDSGVVITPIPPALPPDCDASGFTYRVSVSGGSGSYEIRLLGEGAYYPLNPGPNVHDFSNAANGIVYGVSYTVQVRDVVTGCEYTQVIPPINAPGTINLTATASTASCDASGNGTIDYEVTGITSPANITVTLINATTGTVIGAPATYVSAPIPFNDTFTGLTAGDYQIIVVDNATGCSTEELVTISQDIPSVAIDSNTSANCINPNGQLIVRGVGGTGPYSFSVVPTTTAVGAYSATTVYDLAPGNYDVYVQDSQGCGSVLTNVAINQDAGILPPTVDVTNQCTAVASYTISVTSPLTTGPAPEDTFQYDIGGGFQDSPNFTVPNAGSYTITVRDGNGCTNTVVADVFDFFSITASASAQPSCNNADGTITVSTTGGSGNFEYVLDDGINPVITQNNNNVFNGLAPATYTITVTDLSSNTAPLCSDSDIVEIITVDTPVIDNIVAEHISCNGIDDGSITVDLDPVTATDGPFTYILYDSSNAVVISQPDAIFDNLAPDTYQVEVVSNRGCSSRTGDIIITEPSVLQLNADAPPFSCNLSNNSFNTTTITAFADTNGDGTGVLTGTGPYSYSINDGTPIFDGTNFQSSNTFEIVDNGANQSIIVTVRDNNGCEAMSTVNLTPPSGITFSFNPLTPITCDASGSGVTAGTVEIIINEGAGNYGVEILPLGSQPERLSSGSDRVIWDLDTPGDYIFAVRDIDNGGCLYVTPVYTVADFNTIEAVINEVKPVTCFNDNDGEISIEINNYTGIYNYEVYSRDASGVETTTGVSGSFDTANPINTPEIITGLPAGNLIVYVEAIDAPFCDTVSNVTTVRSPDRPLTVTPAQTSYVTCEVPGRGEITAPGDGGWGGYEYQLELETAPGIYTEQVAYATTNVFSNLSEGNYRVNIRDSGGCIRFGDIILSLPTPISADIQIVQPLLCPGSNDGIIEIFNVLGGEDLNGDGEEYLFQLNRLDNSGTVINTSGLQEATAFPNLPTGYYTITVYDGWSCSFTTPQIFIQDPEPVIAELVETLAPGCGDEGRMQLTITNPIAGMEYFYRRTGTADPFVSFGGVGVSTIEIIVPDVDANPGPYQYDVQNGNGCPFQQSNEIALDKALPLVIGLDLVDANIKCAGEETGIIRSEAFGGVGNYTYTLVNNDLDAAANGGVPRTPVASDIVRSSQSSGIFRDIGPGSYWVYAESSICTAISSIIPISPKDPLVLDRLEAVPVSCNGDVDGQIIIEASGGTGVIRFSISDTLSEFFEGDPANPNAITFTDLPPGTYEIIVQDELGCNILQEVTIDEPQELIVSNVDTTPELCINAADGTAQLTIVGGTPFVDPVSGATYYETSLNSSDDADFLRDDTLFFDNLEGGETYVVFVRDASGCETNVIFPIEVGVDLTAEPIVTYGCEGIFPNSTVSIEMLDTSLLPRLLFSLDVDDLALADTTDTFGDLVPGDHTVYIYHENGCATFVEFTVDAYDPLTLSAVKTGPNEITATAEGGFGGYEFYFQGEYMGATNVFTLNQDETVFIRVVDSNGCEATITMPFDFTGMIEIPNFFTPDGDNLNDVWAPNNRGFCTYIEVKIFRPE